SDVTDVIEIGARFVEHHEAGVAEDSARERYSLPHAARQDRAAFTEVSEIAFGQAHDHVVSTRNMRRSLDFLSRGSPETADIGCNRLSEQLHLLGHVTDG